MENSTMGLDWSGLIGLLIIAGIFGFGNGFGFGGNANASLAQSDIQNALYFQSQDNALRGVSAQIANVNDSVLVGKYDNALLMKDASQQLSNSIAGIGNLITTQTETILRAMNENIINDLRDKLDTTRAELSNVKQTAQITENILGNLATTNPKPPCYYNPCGCGSLY